MTYTSHTHHIRIMRADTLRARVEEMLCVCDKYVMRTRRLSTAPTSHRTYTATAATASQCLVMKQ